MQSITTTQTRFFLISLFSAIMATTAQGQGLSPSDPDYVPPVVEDGSEGETRTYFSLSKGAEIGIIVTAVVLGVGMLVGVILFYIKKKRQWKREGRRRSMISVISMGSVPRRMWDEVRENFKSEKSVKRESVLNGQDTPKGKKWIDVEKQNVTTTVEATGEPREPREPERSWAKWRK